MSGIAWLTCQVSRVLCLNLCAGVFCLNLCAGVLPQVRGLQLLAAPQVYTDTHTHKHTHTHTLGIIWLNLSQLMKLVGKTKKQVEKGLGFRQDQKAGWKGFRGWKGYRSLGFRQDQKAGWKNGSKNKMRACTHARGCAGVLVRSTHTHTHTHT